MRRLALVLPLATIGAAPPAIDHLRLVALHPGVNHVPGFLPGGGTAIILQGWRGNGNAHGFDVWMVLGGPSEGNPVGIVGVAGEDDGRAREPVRTTISDDPFDGERVLGAVRFATATIAGRRASLLIRADLDAAAGGIPADHATARVRWYRLTHDAGAFGRTTDLFVSIGEVRTTRLYCSADVALRDAAGVPAVGGATVDGCIADG